VDAAELARRFGLGTARRLSDGPVARGRQGGVWRLETTDGDFAVKVPFDVGPDEEVRRSTELQEEAWAAGVPTPRVRRTTDGQVLARVSGVPVRVYGWVDLLPPDRRLDPAVVGRVVAGMHRVAPPTADVPEAWYAEPVGAQRWDALIERLLAAGAPFAGRLAELRDELVALDSWVQPPAALWTCHRDLWADNLLPTADGGACVIDWENSGPADLDQELACVLFEFACGDVGRARTLVDAYRAAGGPATVRDPRDFSMLIAQLGHIAEIAAEDWLEPNRRSPHRAGAEAWIHEVIDEPHTRELLERLLAAVR
jgi:Ser/Thr protein kinase RdoA (MazF antagonist)